MSLALHETAKALQRLSIGDKPISDSKQTNKGTGKHVASEAAADKDENHGSLHSSHSGFVGEV